MESWELNIPSVPIRKRGGKFPKGHTPFNRGRKWDEWMDGRKQRKVRRILLSHRQVNMNIGGWNKRAVVGISVDGRMCFFDSSEDAARKLNIVSRNIRGCCDGRRNTAGGVFWRWADEWDGDTTISDEQRRKYEIMIKQQKTKRKNKWTDSYS